jgi:hypothetical protein
MPKVLALGLCSCEKWPVADATTHQRVANETKPRALALVTSSKRCLVHDQSYTRICAGCAADEKAAG